jgi:hypothetical protein
MGGVPLCTMLSACGASDAVSSGMRSQYRETDSLLQRKPKIRMHGDLIVLACTSPW